MLTKLPKGEHLRFLKQKINEIKIAKFTAEINSLLQLPSNIITTLKTDDEGNIWFFTSCNGRYAKNLDKSFYASLEYYNKGSDCWLHIDGKATVIADEEHEGSVLVIKVKNFPAYNIVLIKLKILKAEYFQNKQLITSSFTETVRNIVSELFLPGEAAHKEFSFLENIS